MMQSLTVIEAYGNDVPAQFAHLADQDGLLVEATVWADMERNDYGVPGSPTWYEADVTSVEIEINGVKVKDCPDELYELAAEAAIEKGEWE
jgi:hypothetical protein